MVRPSVFAAACSCFALGEDLYRLDSSWKPQFPKGSHTFSGVAVTFPSRHGSDESLEVVVTQRGNASIDPVLVMNARDGTLVRSWGKEYVALDKTNPSAPTWGAHGIATEYSPMGHVKCRGSDSSTRIWINDFTNCQLSAYNECGEQLTTAGTAGKCDNSTKPLHFGKQADTATIPANAHAPAAIFVSDGDGSTVNRVVRTSVHQTHADSTPEVKLEWATPSEFNNPHSIAHHKASDLLIIADRENNETRLLRASDGADMGIWDCGLRFGGNGKPFGVRTWVKGQPIDATDKADTVDLAFIAIMDNPQDGKNQKIAVVDASGLHPAGGAKSTCKVLQTIEIDPSHFSGPHLLGVNPVTGDIYAALVADHPLSTVLRYKRVGDQAVVV